MQVWKIESRYFWRADPAESLDHRVEAAAAGGGDVGQGGSRTRKCSLTERGSL